MCVDKEEVRKEMEHCVKELRAELKGQFKLVNWRLGNLITKQDAQNHKVFKSEKEITEIKNRMQNPKTYCSVYPLVDELHRKRLADEAVEEAIFRQTEERDRNEKIRHRRTNMVIGIVGLILTILMFVT